jgi:hypothetical protein
MGWKDTIQTVSKQDGGTKSWRDTIQDSPVEDTSVGSYVRSGIAGAGQGVTGGWLDELAALGPTAMNAITGVTGPLGGQDLSSISEDYRDTVNRSRQGIKQAQAEHPVVSGVAELAGAVASPLNKLTPNVSQGTSLAARATNNAVNAGVQGAVTGAGMSEEDNIGGIARDALMGGGIGTLVGGGGTVLGEKVITPGLRKLGDLADNAFQAMPDKLNKGLSKGASFLAGVDEDAALRQIQRPGQVAAAEADDFTHALGNRAVSETEELGKQLGENVNKAGVSFKQNYGETPFKSASGLADKIDGFLETHAPSQKGFSAIDPNQAKELQGISDALRGGDVNGEDLFKFRQYLDNVEKLAGKYDKEGTSPYVNFLKGLRHDADQMIDNFDPNLDSANKAYSQFKGDTGTLRAATNESQAEGMIGNLYGANKGAKQAAASRLFKPETMEAAKDIAANKAFDTAKRPGGDNYFRRGALAVITSGTSEAVTSPWVWQKGLRGVGRIEQILQSDPQRFGRFAGALANAAKRGNQSLAATHFILQQTSPEYREQIKDIEQEPGNGEK